LGYFCSCGLLYGYIYTKYEEVETGRGRDNDAPALAAADRWLHEPPGPNDDEFREDMVNAIKAASIAQLQRAQPRTGEIS